MEGARNDLFLKSMTERGSVTHETESIADQIAREQSESKNRIAFLQQKLSSMNSDGIALKAISTVAVKSLYSYNFENSCRARSFSRVM